MAMSDQSGLEEIFNSLSIILLLDHISSSDPRSRSTPLTTGVNIGIRTGEGAWLQGDLLMKYNILNEQLFLLPFLMAQAFPLATIPSANLKSPDQNELLNAFKVFEFEKCKLSLPKMGWIFFCLGFGFFWGRISVKSSQLSLNIHHPALQWDETLSQSSWTKLP